MSFVATPEQIAAYTRICNDPSYSQEAITVEFVTTKEFIENVLPPTFTPADQPTGLISVSTWQSNACGDFELSSISVRCNCDGREGYYVLNLVLSEPFAITWGRETWGEIKKDGKPRLFGNGNRKYGYCERRGVRLIEMEAEFTDFLEPNTTEWFDFEVKAFPATRGGGLDADPKLITLKVVDHNVRRATGKGKLTLRGSPSDPLHTIPIKAIGKFSYSSGPTQWRVLDERTLCPAADYLPYFIGRHYDDFSSWPIGTNMPNLNEETAQDPTAPQPRTFFS